jgi:hypothetical protein
MGGILWPDRIGLDEMRSPGGQDAGLCAGSMVVAFVPSAGGQVGRRRTSQTAAAMSSTDSASSQPPSIHWNGQNRLPGW